MAQYCKLNNADEVLIRISTELTSWESQLLQGFQQMREDGDLCDALLLTRDGQVAQAHSSLLAAASPVFKGLLCHSAPHHAIALNLLPSGQILRCVLDFIYKGYTSIARKDLEQVCLSAERLQMDQLWCLISSKLGDIKTNHSSKREDKDQKYSSWKSILLSKSDENIQVKERSQLDLPAIVNKNHKSSHIEALDLSLGGNYNKKSLELYDSKDELFMETFNYVESMDSNAASSDDHQTEVSVNDNEIYAFDFSNLSENDQESNETLNIHLLPRKTTDLSDDEMSTHSIDDEMQVLQSPYLPSSKKKKLKSLLRRKKFECPLCRSSFTRRDNLKVHLKKHERNMARKVIRPGTQVRPATTTEMAGLKAAGGVDVMVATATPLEKSIKNEWECFKPTSDNSHETEILLEVSEKKERWISREEHIDDFDCKSVPSSPPHPVNQQLVTEDVINPKQKLPMYDVGSFAVVINGVKKFKCETCNGLFTRANSLRQHILIHTGERPWECRFCEKSFRRKDSYQDHLRLHHGIRIPRNPARRPYSSLLGSIGFRKTSPNQTEVTEANVNATFQEGLSNRAGHLSDDNASGQADSQEMCSLAFGGYLACPECSHSFGSYDELEKHTAEKHNDLNGEKLFEKESSVSESTLDEVGDSTTLPILENKKSLKLPYGSRKRKDEVAPPAGVILKNILLDLKKKKMEENRVKLGEETSDKIQKYLENDVDETGEKVSHCDVSEEEQESIAGDTDSSISDYSDHQKVISENETEEPDLTGVNDNREDPFEKNNNCKAIGSVKVGCQESSESGLKMMIRIRNTSKASSDNQIQPKSASKSEKGKSMAFQRHYFCQVCFKSCSSLEQLERHKALHSQSQASDST